MKSKNGFLILKSIIKPEVLKQMGKLTEKEATLLMNSYGIKCDVKLVKEWLNEGKFKGNETDGIYTIEESAVYDFLELLRWEGTAHEPGIDDQTKLSRLLEEVNDYRQRVKKLEEEKSELERQLQDLLGTVPF
ncbi:hypothetical protein M3649_21340 [Ureibacillus chungkukjangi]|uniref:hypothetical protein n=1 Tax=Ureibacillus chungkukjangi TaxID=1202712 RepID=UPI00203DD895|nr:hypothetical protein [Ureibacillus chungkukjangi]MCM3390630.1 hypothetical protein [Ureibacillus chungkukjangi]